MSSLLASGVGPPSPVTSRTCAKEDTPPPPRVGIRVPISDSHLGSLPLPESTLKLFAKFRATGSEDKWEAEGVYPF